MTSIIEEKFGKLRPGKREQKLITACEKLGYCVQLNKPGRRRLAGDGTQLGKRMRRSVC